jgi:long-subunit fatty acid transport protein
MKKIFFTFFALILISESSKAQETTIDDALRLSIDNTTGSARFRGMSGAFGAVGGDLSAITQNPAGSIFFKNNLGTVTASNNNSKNIARYFGTTNTRNGSVLDLNQIGGVFVFNDVSGQTGWNKIAFALNYENTSNHYNKTFISGTNPYNSLGNYFVDIAQGIPLEYLTNYNYNQLYFYEQQAYLGYDTFLFDATNPNDNNNTSYYTNIPLGGNYKQQNSTITSGYNGKIMANFSSSYKDILMLGVNLNFHFVDIRKSFNIFESNENNIYEDGVTVSRFLFENQLITLGNGVSFNVGAIVQPVKNLRVGLSYESPTWYRLNDELTQGVATKIVSPTNSGTNFSSYQPTMVYEAYKVQTPDRWTGSLAYIFEKKGMLSVDVSTKNYGSTRLKPKNDFSGINSHMNSVLDNAIEVRLGGEYIYKQFAFRAGYRFDESPYKVDQSFGDLTGYSAGLGYSFGENRIDLAYTYEHRNQNLNLISSGMTDPARISRYNNNVTLSYSINF